MNYAVKTLKTEINRLQEENRKIIPKEGKLKINEDLLLQNNFKSIGVLNRAITVIETIGDK